jgi:hypothetical protein
MWRLRSGRRCQQRRGGISIRSDGDKLGDLVGFFTINITDIIQRLRARANAAGIDLSRPFFYPPGDPRFNEILTQVKRELDARIVRLRRDKKKFAAAKGHARRSRNITVLPRVMNVKYPFAMQEMR